MLTAKTHYECRCEKCGKEWRTRTDAIPKACPKCHRVTWNDDGSSAPFSMADVGPLKVIATMPEFENVVIESITLEKPKVWQWFGGARLKDGIWIRNQLCGKETRTVEVGADDHDKILRVLKDEGK